MNCRTLNQASIGMNTILLVDDDQQVREFLGLALRRSGFYVIEADSGVAALPIARHRRPDLIVSDIDMPGGDGASLLREIRLDPELRSGQIVLMTGSPDLLARRRDCRSALLRADSFPDGGRSGKTAGAASATDPGGRGRAV